MSYDHPKYPRPGGSSLFVRQLRQWGTDVVRAIVGQSVRGDGRRIAAKQLPGGVSLTYMEDPPQERSFYAYFKRGSHLAKSGDKVVIRAGTVRTPDDTDTVNESEEALPTSGNSKYWWIRIADPYTGTITASLQSNTTGFPAYRDTSNDYINVPLCQVDESSTGVWELTRYNDGDILLGYQGLSVSGTDHQMVAIDGTNALEARYPEIDDNGNITIKNPTGSDSRYIRFIPDSTDATKHVDVWADNHTLDGGGSYVWGFNVEVEPNDATGAGKFSFYLDNPNNRIVMVLHDQDELQVQADVHSTTKFVCNGGDGISTSFVDADGNTIVTTGGIVTAKNAP